MDRRLEFGKTWPAAAWRRRQPKHSNCCSSMNAVAMHLHRQSGTDLMIAELAALMLTCAPNVHPVTLKAVIRHESRLNPYAIGVNSKEHRLKSQPGTLDDAKEIVQGLIKQGIDFDEIGRAHV